MSITLSQILSLVGRLDDAPGSEAPRERFRHFLADNVTEIGELRDYIQECLRTPGEQYNRALQDLVNYLGQFLGFTVAYGRYQGVQGQIGFDGHWTSSSGFHVVVEVKTSEVYAVKTAALINYVHELISAKHIPSMDDAVGLYIIGRPDPTIRQLEHAIVGENKAKQLRLVSVESLLLLAEMMNEYDVRHQDVLALLQPSGPGIDPIVDLMSRVVAQPRRLSIGLTRPSTTSQQPIPTEPLPTDQVAYWITPVKSDEDGTAEEIIQTHVGEKHVYAFGERTPGRTQLKVGDWICFYASTKGVVAHAQVATQPSKEQQSPVRHPELYPWLFHLTTAHLYTDDPTVVDVAVRSRLDAFKDRDLNRSWAWFVQATHRITEHDFRLLTQQEPAS